MKKVSVFLVVACFLSLFILQSACAQSYGFSYPYGFGAYNSYNFGYPYGGYMQPNYGYGWNQPYTYGWDQPSYGWNQPYSYGWTQPSYGWGNYNYMYHLITILMITPGFNLLMAMDGISPPMAGMVIIIHTITIPMVTIHIITDTNITPDRMGPFTELALEARLD